jgi:hypothetical protein
VTNDVPAQIEERLGQKFSSVGQAVGEAGKGLEIIVFVLSLFLTGALQQLLN